MFRIKCIILLATLASPCSSLAEVYFHSDFELGETFTAAEIHPGQKTILLMHNEKLDEWPVYNGRGMVEGDAPAQVDTFTYERREGNRLQGVRGIRRRHGRRRRRLLRQTVQSRRTAE